MNCLRIEDRRYGFEKDSINYAEKVSAAIAKLHAEIEFEKYRIVKDRLFISDYDKYMLELES